MDQQVRRSAILGLAMHTSGHRSCGWKGVSYKLQRPSVDLPLTKGQKEVGYAKCIGACAVLLHNEPPGSTLT